MLCQTERWDVVSSERYPLREVDVAVRSDHIDTMSRSSREVGTGRISSVVAGGLVVVAVVVAMVVAMLVGAVISGPDARIANASPRSHAAARSSASTSRHSLPAAASYTRDRLEAVAFTTPARGHGLVVHEGTTRCTDEVGPTNDGGARFAPLVAVTTWRCADSAPAHSLTFDDHGDGFLFGPELFVTHDDGRTWSRAREAGDVLAVDPLGSSIWMLQAICASPAARTCPLRLLVSNDGGRSWSPSKVTPRGRVNPFVGQGAQGQTWLDRVSRSSAYLVASPVTNREGHPDSAPLWRTTDAGASWAKRSIPCAFDALSVTLSVAPDGELFALCAGEPSAGSQVKSVLASSDGGLHWHLQSSCDPLVTPSPPCAAHDVLDSGYLGSIDAMSATTLLLVGDRSSLLVSHDAGVDWRSAGPLIGGTGDGTSQAVVLGARDAVVLGENEDSGIPTLWHTVDAGEQWRAVVPRID